MTATRGLATVLGLALSITCWADDESAPAEAEAFDAAAVVAAASVPPAPGEFKRLWTSKTPVRLFHGLAISRDGSRVMACRPDGKCVVYNAETGDEISVLAERPPSLIVRTALSPDGATAALGLMSGELLIMESATGKVLQRRNESKVELIGVSFDPEGKVVCTVDKAGVFRRTGLAGENPEVGNFTLKNQATLNSTYAFSPSGRLFACQPNYRTKKPSLLVLPKVGGSVSPKEIELEFFGTAVAFAQGRTVMTCYTLKGDIVWVRQPYYDETQPLNFTGIPSNLPIDMQLTRHLGISTDEKWFLGVGRGKAEIFTGSCIAYPSVHNAEFEQASQVAVSGDIRRFAIVDENGHLAVLSLSELPALPAWEFDRVVSALCNDKRYDELEQLAREVMYDSDCFPFRQYLPKYEALDMILDRSLDLEAFRAARPDSVLVRLRTAQKLITEGWDARGSGFARDVTPENFAIFHEKIAAAHLELKPLLELDKPPPDAFALMTNIAQGESWDHLTCIGLMVKLMEVSPGYEPAHRGMILKFLPRWGGDAQSAVNYAGWVADQLEPDAGDALYAKLMFMISCYEPKQVFVEERGVDFERAFQGCAALQKMPNRREIGLFTELHFAAMLDDGPRLGKLTNTITREKSSFIASQEIERQYYELLYRNHLGRTK